MNQQKTKKYLHAFTLVELIIVITILAILSTIAFVSFQWYTTSSRDTTRLSTVTNITKWLDTFGITVGYFPIPDSITATWVALWKNVIQVWKISSWVTKMIWLSANALDPKTGNPYQYWITTDGKDYQVWFVLEKPVSWFISSTYAQNSVARVEGVYKWLLKYSTGGVNYIANFPSLIFATWWTIDLIIGEPYYVINNWKNLPYSIDKEPTTVETKNLIVSQKVGKAVTIQNLNADNFLDSQSSYVTKLWYTKDEVALKVLWNNYQKVLDSHVVTCDYDECLPGGYYVILSTNSKYANGCRSTNLPWYNASQAVLAADTTQDNPYFKCIYKLASSWLYISPWFTDSTTLSDKDRLHINENRPECNSLTETCDYIKNYPAWNTAPGYCKTFSVWDVSWFLPAEWNSALLDIYNNESKIWWFSDDLQYWSSSFVSHSVSYWANWFIRHSSNTTAKADWSYVNPRKVRCVFK
jgi:prepilin-type N-terminal cleavage/methylation domain-containing protein